MINKLHVNAKVAVITGLFVTAELFSSSILKILKIVLYRIELVRVPYEVSGLVIFPVK